MPGYCSAQDDAQSVSVAQTVALLSGSVNETWLRQLASNVRPSSAGLLHSSGLAKRWLEAGVRWVCFFQDTNGLVFRALPAALGVRPKYCLCPVGCLAQRRRTRNTTCAEQWRLLQLSSSSE